MSTTVEDELDCSSADAASATSDNVCIEPDSLVLTGEDGTFGVSIDTHTLLSRESVHVSDSGDNNAVSSAARV